MVASACLQTLKFPVGSTMNRPALEVWTTTFLSERTSISTSLWAACSVDGRWGRMTTSLHLSAQPAGPFWFLAENRFPFSQPQATTGFAFFT